MINKLVVLLVAAGMSMTLCAMPTAEEQEKVRPLVQGLMKPDLDAMKQGKKSRSDVAKSAMDLYSKADSPAAKMLLARNALNLYAKAGEYEAAESALDALLSAVPDYPAVDIAELLEKTLHPIPNRAAPNLRARLAAVKDKAQAASQLKKLLSIYDTLAEGPKRKACAARIASAYVALDDWPNANKYFAVSDSPAAAAASAELKLQDEPEASRPYDKPADAWWSVELPKKDAKLSAAIRSHAAALYAKSLPSLKGLAKVQAERRIAEVDLARQPEPVAAIKSGQRENANSYIETAGSCFFIIDGTTFLPATDTIEIEFLQSINSVFAIGGSTFGVTDAGQGAGIRWGSPAKRPIPNSARKMRHKLIISPDGVKCDDSEMRFTQLPDFGKLKLSPLYLWGWDNNGADCQAEGGRIFSVKITRKGKPVLNLQPEKTPRVGLVDKVSNKHYFPVRGNAIYGEVALKE